MSQRILLRFSMPNMRGQKKQCQLCSVKFQKLGKKQHQCKRCLRLICQDCGPQRRKIYEPDGSTSVHRCCTICIKQIQQISQYYTKYKLCFGQDSQFVSQWISRLNKDRIGYDFILNQFSDNITTVTNDNTIRFKRQSTQIISQFFDSCNYSLRNFIKQVTQGINFQILQNKLRNVMIAIFGRVKSIPYVPELIYLVAFFLCFANQAHTYFIITRMIQKIYPLYVHMKKMQKDKLLAGTFKTILQMYRICVQKVDRNQIQAIAQYLQARFSHYTYSFTLNVCSLPTSFFIINQMLKSGTCVPFYKGIAIMFSLCREQIGSYKSFIQVQIPVLRSVSIQKVKNSFILFQKSDAKFEVTNQVFDSVEHRKLHEKYKQIESLYNKSQKSINEKQAKIKQMLVELSSKKNQLQQQVQKNKKLQLQLLKVSHNIPKLLKYEQMSQMYQSALSRNKVLQQKCSELEQQCQKFEKQNKLNDKYKRNWASMQQEYQRQIVQLKTKYEIMEIQITAKQIDFNTSFIERKFEAKNLQINMMKQEMKQLRNQLQHYKLKAMQKNFTKIKRQNTMKYDFTDNKQQRQKQFDKFIVNSKNAVQNLTKQVSNLKTLYEQTQRNVKILQQKNTQLQQKVKQNEEISRIIRQVPESYNYVQAIQQMQRVIEKQANFMRKKTLESVRQSYIKCYNELKFRTIDCRIKEQKIVNSEFLSLFNLQKMKNLPQYIKQQQKSTNDALADVLEAVQNTQKDVNNRKDCLVM